MGVTNPGPLLVPGGQPNFPLPTTAAEAEAAWLAEVSASGVATLSPIELFPIPNATPFSLTFGGFGLGSYTPHSDAGFDFAASPSLGFEGFPSGQVGFSFIESGLGTFDFTVASYIRFLTPVATAFSLWTYGIGSATDYDALMPLVEFRFFLGGAPTYTWDPTLCGLNPANNPLGGCRLNGGNTAFLGISNVPAFDEIRMFGRSGDGFYWNSVGIGSSLPIETVPEPATMTLLATGLVGLAGARRRKKTRA